MPLTLGLVTDIHFGPKAHFDGKLRKLSHEGPRLLADAIEMLRAHALDLLVNLGDDIEDESREADLERYQDCQRILRSAGVPVINVAGNHDTIHLNHDDLSRVWDRPGQLSYALDAGPLRLVVLHTIERKDLDVRIDAAQLAWLREELASGTKPVLVLMHHSASDQDTDDSRWFSRAPHLALVKERAELRAILRESGRVKAVFNGHLHRNHLDVIDGIPYVTLQSLIENLDDDAPGRPAGACAVVRIDDRRIVVRVLGQDPARYQFAL